LTAGLGGAVEQAREKGAEFAPGLPARSKVPAVCRYFAGCELLAISGNRRCTRGEKSALMLIDEVELLGGGPGVTNGRTGSVRVSCEDCFFRQNLLCAVSSDGPCATYRPNHPDGLRPPSQLQFVFRQDRRLQVAWAFPSPSEQVALHAGV
jgi:hypothetical protein